MWIIREFIDDMVSSNEGHIVSIASMAGLAGNAYMSDYCASKFASIGLMESLRIEMKLANQNV